MLHTIKLVNENESFINQNEKNSKQISVFGKQKTEPKYVKNTIRIYDERCMTP
jgi:hypothetical protein